jgi:hypothetical protein
MIRKARVERAALRSLTRENRAAARINRRGTGSLTTHALAAGLAPKAARTVASSLRRAAAKLGIAGESGRAHAGRRMRTTTRYTRAQVAAIAVIYRPRKSAYITAAARLVLAA